MSAVVFVGPTISVKDVRSVIDAVCLPPVAQGDVYRVARQKPRAIGIVDGYFQGAPSVWHKEILWAMGVGIHVFGSASMGALRAAELHAFGMQGIGQIFEGYRDGKLEDDDEVAVTHAPEEFGFEPLSEPMVNIRATLERAEREGAVSGVTAQTLCGVGKSLFYAERTWDALLGKARSDGLSARELQSFKRWLPTGRLDLKREDALAMLTAMNQLLQAGTAPKRVDYDFEWTDAWDKVTVHWSAVSTDLDDGTSLARARILDELRLQGDVFRAAIRRATLRFLALREADRRRMQIDTHAQLAKMTDHRKQRALFRRVDLDDWLSHNQMDISEFEGLMMDEVRVEAVSRLSEPALNEHLIAELKLGGEYARLVERARHKHDALTRVGCTHPEPDETGLNPIQLVAWYFEKRLGQPMPDDMDAYVQELGLSSRTDFYRILAGEHIYLTHNQEES